MVEFRKCFSNFLISISLKRFFFLVKSLKKTGLGSHHSEKNGILKKDTNSGADM